MFNIFYEKYWLYNNVFNYTQILFGHNASFRVHFNPLSVKNGFHRINVKRLSNYAASATRNRNHGRSINLLKFIAHNPVMFSWIFVCFFFLSFSYMFYILLNGAHPVGNAVDGDDGCSCCRVKPNLRVARTNATAYYDKKKKRVNRALYTTELVCRRTRFTPTGRLRCTR